MTNLYLLRHAKAAQATAGGSDFERILEASGRNDAVAIGRFFSASELPKPDLILCSPASRTRETLACFYDGARLSEIREFSDDLLYKGDSSDYLEAIKTHAEDAKAVLVIGHNPMIEDLAHRLIRTHDEKAFSELQQGYVTSGFAHFELDDGFESLDDKMAKLVRFENPATIDA